MGISIEAAGGRPVAELVPAGPMLQDRCREAIAAGRAVRFEHASGGRVYEFEICPTASGGAAIWFREITRRKQMEDDLRSNEQRLRLLIDNVKDYAMFAIDTHGRVTSWNPGAERILGFCESDILGKPAEIIFTPEDRESGEAEREMRKALAEGRAEDERWHMRKDGTRFYASGILTTLWDERGELAGFSKILRDFTERRKSEEALLQAQKLESVGVLAGGIAHDFNNLLTAILGNVSLVLDFLPPDDPNRALLGSAIDASERAHKLTGQLLAYAGKGKFWVQPLNVSVIIADMEDLLRAAVPKKTELRFRLASGLAPVHADPAQIQQLVTNLVSNAGEAIGDERRGRVTVTTSMAPGDYVLVEVEDNGGGMDESVKARVFDPFFTTKFTGRGLGLAAVSGIVRSQDGRIEVDSAPGGGSRFRVFLPAGRPATAESLPVEHTAHAPGIVLLVEDERLVRETAAHSLERHGFEVLAASDAADAVQLLEANRDRVGLALVDFRMPDMSGHELVPLLHKVRPDLNVLVTSGYPEDETRRMFTGQTIAGFIQKPYRAAELAEKVKALIESGE